MAVWMFQMYARMDVFRCARFGRTRVCMAVLTLRAHACVHGRVDVFGCIRAWTSLDVHMCASFGRTHGRLGRTRVCGRARGCVHGAVGTFARGHVYGLVAMHVRIVHRLNFMDDWVIWPNYTDGRMQLKAKAMQLKVKGMQLKMEACN